MVPKYHIILGFLFSSILFLICPSITFLSAGIIFLSSFLIDIDHYIYFAFKKRDLSPRRAVKWFFKKKKVFLKIPKEKRNSYYSGFYFLHGLESILILFFLGLFISDIFLFIFIGFLFHLILDFIEEATSDKRIDKISIIYDFIKFKQFKEIE
jgi:hypothetical protein